MDQVAENSRVKKMGTENRLKTKKKSKVKKSSSKKLKKPRSKHSKKRIHKRHASTSSDSSNSSSSSSSSSSSDTSEEEKIKKRKKKNKKKKLKEKKAKLEASRNKAVTEKLSSVVPVPSKPIMAEADVGPHIDLKSSKIRAPMTKEEYEKQQSTLKWITDPETGRRR